MKNRILKNNNKLLFNTLTFSLLKSYYLSKSIRYIYILGDILSITIEKRRILTIIIVISLQVPII